MDKDKSDEFLKLSEMFALYRDFFNWCAKKYPIIFDEFIKHEEQNNLMFKKFRETQRQEDNKA